MKFVPALISLVFTALVAGAFLMPDKLDLLARLSSKESGQHAHYEQLFTETTFTDLEGNKIKLAEAKAPVVILNFWAAWCKPCLEEFPSLVQLRGRFDESELLVIGINADEENQERQIAKTVEDFDLNFPIVADQNSELINKFMISGLPISIVYKNGKVEVLSKGKKDFMAEEFVQIIRTARSRLFAKPHVN